jgi:hypothetical protein
MAELIPPEESVHWNGVPTAMNVLRFSLCVTRGQHGYTRVLALLAMADFMV